MNDVHPKPESNPRPYVLAYAIDSVLFAVAIALGFTLVELILASNDIHWLGGTAAQWFETTAVIGAYAVPVAMFTFALAVLIRIATKHQWIDGYVAAVTAFLSAMGLWTFLRSYSPEMVGFRVEVVIFIAIGAFTVIANALSAAGIVRLRVFAVQLAATLGGTIAVLRYVTILLADNPIRVDFAAYAAVASLVATLFVVLICDVLFRRDAASARTTAIAILISFLTPATLYAIPKLRAIGQQDQPNFLLISADTLRADESSVYGGPVAMPALQSLADRGVVFDRFYTTAPWTVPSLCSLFSGRFPVSLTPGLDPDAREAEETSLHRLYSYWRGASGPTLVGGFRLKGYRTMAVVANPATNAHEWLWQDFDSYQLVNDIGFEMYGPFGQAPLFRNALNAIRPGTIQKRPIDSTRRVVHYARTLLKTRADKPFFLWVHFMDPHTPYDPPAELRTPHGRWSMFPPTDDEKIAEPDWWADMTPDEQSFAHAQYRGEIAYIDTAVGEILQVLDRSRFSGTTYTCFFSDHGEEFWEHERWGHGQTLFDEQIRVPFVFAGPGVGVGRVKDPVSAIDFAPTIADLFDSIGNTGWHGQSFARMLRDPGKPASQTPVFAQATQHAMYGEEPLQMVIKENLKFVRGLDSGYRGLFDLAADPGEQINLADTRPEDAERLNAILETWSERFPSTVQEALGGGVPLETDADVRETMKAIGYTSE